MDANTKAEFRAAYAAEAASVPAARSQLRDWLESAEADERCIPDVLLAVTEACANAARHAYPEGDGIVRIRATSERGHLDVVVRDYGASIQRARPESAGLGLGLPIMGRLASDLEISTSPGFGTEVRMHFSAPSTPADRV
jgi:serine/threonine-protein kinase RsbW